MYEVLLLLALVILSPVLPYASVWVLGTCIVVAPSVYAMLTGAPFLPTNKQTMAHMFELAQVKQGQAVYDLGCGDGRIVFEAARKKAHSIGYELSPLTFLIAWIRSVFTGLGEIHYANFWNQNYREADVIFCFLLTSSMLTFEQRIWPTLKPGCRVVSHAFKMKEVAPERTIGDVSLYVK